MTASPPTPSYRSAIFIHWGTSVQGHAPPPRQVGGEPPGSHTKTECLSPVNLLLPRQGPQGAWSVTGLNRIITDLMTVLKNKIKWCTEIKFIYSSLVIRPRKCSKFNGDFPYSNHVMETFHVEGVTASEHYHGQSQCSISSKPFERNTVSH